MSMANIKYLIWMLAALFCICHASNTYYMNGVQFRIDSDLRESDKNVANGLKNYFARYDIIKTQKASIIIKDSEQIIKKSMEIYGYFSPLIKTKYTFVNGTLTIDYLIRKRAQVYVTGVDISIPNEIIQKAGIKKDVKTIYKMMNQPYDGVTLAAKKANILDQVRKIGYPFAQFNLADISFSNPTKVNIALKLNLNKHFRFGAMTVKNNHTLSDDFVKRFAMFKAGDDFNTVLLNQFQKDLVSSGFFDEVTVKYINWSNQSSIVPIMVDVKDAKPWMRNYTIGYDDKYHFGGSVRYQIKPINPLGHTLELFLRLATNDYVQLKTNYIIPGYRPLQRYYTFSAQVLTQDLNSGEVENSLLTASMNQVFDYITVIPSINAFIEKSTPNGQSSYTTKLIYPQLNLAFKILKPYDWLKRLYLYTGIMITGENDLSDVSMQRVNLGGDAVFPVAEKINLKLSGEFGALSSDQMSEVPLSMKFYAGGPDSIRGYSFNEFGPGKYKKNLSYELQYAMSNLIEPFVFVDHGNASDRWDDKMKTGIGLGVMFNFQVVGLKFSLAHGLDDGADPFKIQFTVQSML